MFTTIRTNSAHPGFRMLVGLLDAELSVRNGENDAFFSAFNKIDMIDHAVVALQDDEPVACGAIKPYDDGSAEVKRMYVKTGLRGKGIASIVLKELETWAAELGFTACILETGTFMPDAVALYKKNGYAVIPNYGQYAGVEISVCMKKTIQ